MTQAIKKEEATPESSGKLIRMSDLVADQPKETREVHPADSSGHSDVGQVIDGSKVFGKGIPEVVEKKNDWKQSILFIAYYFMSRSIRLINWVVSQYLAFTGHKIQVACISNCRDMIDVRKFGFSSIRDFPDFMPWIMFRWNKVWGQLYMIGSVTEEIGGDNATNSTINRARVQFSEAVKVAIGKGAQTILYAAATKRLFKKGELETMFPEVIFTLGDNFTGLLLGEAIMDAFSRSNLEPKKAKVLLIAPYGLLGGVALHYLCQAGSEVILMGSRKRSELLIKIAQKNNLSYVFSFEDVGAVDMVVACNSSPGFKLDSDKVELLRRPHKKLIVIDPNEPQNMSPEAYGQCHGTVLRYDAGNGMDLNLHYVLGSLASSILRLRPYVSWGCFCETLIIAANQSKLESVDWYEISPKNIGIISEFFGKGEGQIGLPAPLNFNTQITDFSLEVR